jgi:predicted flavoprotein YhiN
MNIAIIGAGACGLLLSTKLSQKNINHTIFYKDKIGSKILASGNGKCNISNKQFNKKYYHNNPFSKIVSDKQAELFNYFNELKIYTKVDQEGRMYPISESSQSVLNVLLKNSKANFVNLCVDKIERSIEIMTLTSELVCVNNNTNRDEIKSIRSIFEKEIKGNMIKKTQILDERHNI